MTSEIQSGFLVTGNKCYKELVISYVKAVGSVKAVEVLRQLSSCVTKW